MIVAVDMLNEAMNEKKEGNGCRRRLQGTRSATLIRTCERVIEGKELQAMFSCIIGHRRGRRRQSRQTFWEVEEQRTRLAETSRGLYGL